MTSLFVVRGDPFASSMVEGKLVEDGPEGMISVRFPRRPSPATARTALASSPAIA